MWNKDEVKGKTSKAKGKAKQAVGDLTGDRRLRDEGTADEAAGRTREAFGTGRRKLGNAVRKVGNKIKR
jgi:uncharacterized protein YjbJ (UPF0337 family)